MLNSLKHTQYRVQIVALVMYAAIAPPSTMGAGANIVPILDGLISRGEMLLAGRITFHYTRSGSQLPAVPLDAPPSEPEMILAFRGREWALRFGSGMQNTLINKNGFRAVYTAFPAIDQDKKRTGHLDHVLRLEASDPLQNLDQASQWKFVVRLGTFLYPQTIRFADEQRSAVIDRGEQVIDGYNCRVLAWKVTPEDYDEAFLKIPNTIVRAGGGYLVAYVAPSLAHAMPLYEYQTFEGAVALRVKADNFKQLCAGCYYPNAVSITTITGDGKENTDRLSIVAAQDFNSELPSDLFDLQFPEGTKVYDSRPGIPFTVFTAGEKPSLGSVLAQLSEVPEESKPKHLRGVPVQWLVVANVVIFFAIFVVFAFKKRALLFSRRRSAPDS